MAKKQDIKDINKIIEKNGKDVAKRVFDALINNEINLKVDADDDSELFDKLDSLFLEYWNQAMPLEYEKLAIFKKCMEDRAPGYCDYSKQLGDVTFKNVIGGVEKSKKDSFIEDFKKKYLLYVDAFRKLEKMYMASEERDGIMFHFVLK